MVWAFCHRQVALSAAQVYVPKAVAISRTQKFGRCDSELCEPPQEVRIDWPEMGLKPSGVMMPNCHKFD
jgi:hypothetical protein